MSEKTDQQLAAEIRQQAKRIEDIADGNNLDDPLHPIFDALLDIADQLDMRRLPKVRAK